MIDAFQGVLTKEVSSLKFIMSQTGTLSLLGARLLLIQNKQL